MSAIEPSLLPGVTFGLVKRQSDTRGSFRELWRREVFDGWDPIAAGNPDGEPVRAAQANLSTSAAGVLRGLHLHRHQIDHWVVASGIAFVALVDIRPLLTGMGERPLVETRWLAADHSVTIPTGVAHGFLAVERIELIYVVTNTYDGSDELGFAWDDPAVGVPWPEPATVDRRPILSDRDAVNPSLADLVASLRA